MAMTSPCLCMYAGFFVALQSPALRLFFTGGVQSQDLAAQAEPAFAMRSGRDERRLTGRVVQPGEDTLSEVVS